MSKNSKDIKFVFFGTSSFSIRVLDALAEKGFMPRAVVTFPDKPVGRKQVLTPNPVKAWAQDNGIEIMEVRSFKKEPESIEELKKFDADLFVVASFGRILPAEVIYQPPHQTLNVHPSLLPRLRGPAPLQDTIRLGEEAGVTIMRIDEEMDHGPLLLQKKVEITGIPTFDEMEKILGQVGGELLAEAMPKWVAEELPEIVQDESKATYTKMIEKEDGLLDLSAEAEANLRKVRAYSSWPGTYLIFKKKNGEEIRVVVKDGEIADGEFKPTRVVPAGKKEMSWEDFLRGNL